LKIYLLPEQAVVPESILKKYVKAVTIKTGQGIISRERKYALITL